MSNESEQNSVESTDDGATIRSRAPLNDNGSDTYSVAQGFAGAGMTVSDNHIVFSQGAIGGLDAIADSRAVKQYLRDLCRELSTYIAEMLLLSAEDRPDAVQEAPSRILNYANIAELRQKKVLESGTPVGGQFSTFVEAFDHHHGRLMVLGDPGAGKTTTLLQHAYNSALRCLEHPNDYEIPVPVFRRIAVDQWDGMEPLRQWITRDISKCYPGLNTKAHRLIYLLDGLDELGGEKRGDQFANDQERATDRRSSFLRAIEEQMLGEMVVVSCRLEDYEQIGERSSLSGAVQLLPLSPEFIKQYLVGRNQDRLWQSLSADADMLDLVSNPLMLYLFSSAIGQEAITETRGPVEPTSIAVFDFYIRRRFEIEGAKRNLPFSERTTRYILSRLAAQSHGFRRNLLGEYTYSFDERGIYVKAAAGFKWKQFIDFACQMRFIKRISTDVSACGSNIPALRRLKCFLKPNRGCTKRQSEVNVEFIHLKFRDFCAVPRLVDVLTSRDEYTRERACLIIGNSADGLAIPALSRRLKDRDIGVRLYASQAIIQLGEVIELSKAVQMAATRTAIIALNALDPEMQIIACGVLASNKTTASVAALTERLKDSNPAISNAAANAIINVGYALNVDRMIEGLGNINEFPQYQVCRILGAFKEPSAVGALIQLIKADDFSATQDDATKLMKAAVQYVAACLMDADPEVRDYGQQWLAQAGDKQLRALVTEALVGQRVWIRAAACQALGYIGDPSAVPVLCLATIDASPLIREVACEALGLIKQPSAILALEEALSDHQPVREAAEWAIRRIRTPRIAWTKLKSLEDACLIMLTGREDLGWIAVAPNAISIIKHLNERYGGLPDQNDAMGEFEILKTNDHPEFDHYIDNFEWVPWTRRELRDAPHP